MGIVKAENKRSAVMRLKLQERGETKLETQVELSNPDGSGLETIPERSTLKGISGEWGL